MSSMAKQMFTYQTRLTVTPAQDAMLSRLAALYSRVERHLFVAQQQGKLTQNELKQTYQTRFGLNSRYFNSINESIRGKILAIQELKALHVSELQSKIAALKKQLKKLSTQPVTSAHRFAWHHKNRRLIHLERKLTVVKKSQDSERVSLCFGSKKLFRQQFQLAKNGFDSHAAWLAAWQQARNNQFLLVGAGCETACNQNCQISAQDETHYALKITLPASLIGEQGKQLHLTDIRFPYGDAVIRAAMDSSQRIATVSNTGKPISKLTGTPITYRFLKDDTSWRLLVTVGQTPLPSQTSVLAGAMGIDVNVDHLALAETDRFGNLIDAARLPLVTYGKSTNQSRALIGDAAKHIALRAQAAGKPVVIEKLDFKRKKAELETDNAARARCLSSFAYGKILSSIKAACFRAGVVVIEVNPAYTSVIGAVNYAQKKGISVHMAAAFAIARRGMRLSELPPTRQVCVPTRNGDHVTFVLPVRDNTKHVWSTWSKIRTALNTAHVAHFRRGERSSSPPPLREHPSLRAVWKSQVNRTQICPECVLDIPF